MGHAGVAFTDAGGLARSKLSRSDGASKTSSFFRNQK